MPRSGNWGAWDCSVPPMGRQGGGEESLSSSEGPDGTPGLGGLPLCICPSSWGAGGRGARSDCPGVVEEEEDGGPVREDGGAPRTGGCPNDSPPVLLRAGRADAVPPRALNGLEPVVLPRALNGLEPVMLPRALNGPAPVVLPRALNGLALVGAVVAAVR